MEKLIQPRLCPKFNLIIERLNYVIMVLADLGVFPIEKNKYILYISNQKSGLIISQPIGYPDLSLEKSLEINDTACRCCRKIGIPMITIHDYHVGIFSEFNNPQLEQAISLLLSVVINYMEYMPELSLTDPRLVSETDLANRLFFQNPLIHGIAELFVKANISGSAVFAQRSLLN